jgi:hypothetical protein
MSIVSGKPVEHCIISLRWKQVGLLPEGDDQSLTSAHPAQCLARMVAQLSKGWTELGQLVLFPV